MSEWKIYHNPKCSKSRDTLKLLRENGIEPEVVEYLKNPPTREELKKMIEIFEGPAHLLVRTTEDLYRELKFDLSSENEIVENLARHPALLERPFVVTPTAATLGRPPENVLRYLPKN